MKEAKKTEQGNQNGLQRASSPSVKLAPYIALMIALILSCAAAQDGISRSTSPKEVLRRFCDLDIAGRQLTPDGWRQLSGWFAYPRSAFPAKFIVVKRRFEITNPELNGNEAAFFVDYIELGQLDSNGHYYALPGPLTPGPVKIRREYILVHAMEEAASRQATPVRKVGRLARWKIKKGPDLPHISIETAIEYVSNLRDHTNDDKLKRYAEAALLELRRQR